MSVRFTPRALRRLLFIGGSLLLGATARAQSPTVDPAFPPVQVTRNVADGGIYDVVRQPDGKYVVGGYFQALNGQPASNLARLNADGTVDAAFTAACATNGPVGALALLPDGKILVGGAFQTLGGGTRAALARLRTDGTLDPAFNPGFSTGAGYTNSVGNLLVQPDGKVLITGSFYLLGSNSPQYMTRFDGATGQADPGFQFTPPTADSRPTRMVLQPDGKVVVGGNVPSYRPAALLMRVEANGATDSGFPPIINPYTGGVYSLALDGAGRIYAGGSFNSLPGGGLTLRRYLPTGTEDRSFAYNSTGASPVGAVALQPNGQLLVGSAATQRLQADGSLDATYLSANGPIGNPNSAFRKVVVEPGGAILVAGAFTVPGTTGDIGLVRLNAAGVLAVRSGAAASQLAAWPVPAHETLNLRLDMAARPQSVQLLDALGRPVRHVPQPAAELSLPVAGLPAGSYQLRVVFADGSQATRRVLLH